MISSVVKPPTGGFFISEIPPFLISRRNIFLVARSVD
nr:MAG TPA: hypothetical protein [Caudoviricetes sp.]